MIILQKMARCQLRTNVLDIPPWNDARIAIMYRFVCREHIDVLPDLNIAEELASPSYPSRDCNCCSCRTYASVIVAPAETVDSSDSVFNLSNTWSDESSTVDVTCCTSDEVSTAFSESDNNSINLETQTQSNMFDDFDSQLWSDSEYAVQHAAESAGIDSDIQMPGDLAACSPGVSFSDAETQPPYSYDNFTFPNYMEVSSCDTETHLGEASEIPSLYLENAQIEDTDTDSSTQSVSILKCRK